MFKRLRVALLLYALLFVAAAEFFAARRATDWDAPLWVDIYGVAGDADPETQRYVGGLSSAEFADAQTFLAREAKRYGVMLEQPFKFRVVGQHLHGLPQLGPRAGSLDVLWWSLRMRWLAARLRWRDDGPTGDILLFAVFHKATEGVALDRSTALDKGLIAVANLFAAREARGTNQVVFAHELLHTLRASDKYSPLSNAPLYPDGYAAPDAHPRLPQTKAELMAGRIPLDEQRAKMPASLREVVIGPTTAREIGWQPR